MTLDLNGGVAVITGAAGGIGLGLTRACLDRGMRVIISDLDGARLGETAEALRDSGGSVVDHPADVRSLPEVEGLRDAAIERYGQVDLVCGNAGVGLTRPLIECTDADWKLLFDVNVGGVANGIRTFLPLMVEQGWGHLNATSSLSGLVADAGLAIYNGTKFAVAGLMEALAVELAQDHPALSASVLCPGPVATELMATSEKQLAEAGSDASSDEDVASYLAAGLHPDEVGRVAVEGIVAGRFWLLTHPEYTFEIMDPRYEAMKAGALWVPPDAWVDQR